MSLLSMLFGCTHKHLTFPQSKRNGKSCYVCCLECGKEFPYSWTEMKVVTKQDERRKAIREAEA